MGSFFTPFLASLFPAGGSSGVSSHRPSTPPRQGWRELWVSGSRLCLRFPQQPGEKEVENKDDAPKTNPGQLTALHSWAWGKYSPDDQEILRNGTAVAQRPEPGPRDCSRALGHQPAFCNTDLISAEFVPVLPMGQIPNPGGVQVSTGSITAWCSPSLGQGSAQTQTSRGAVGALLKGTTTSHPNKAMGPISVPFKHDRLFHSPLMAPCPPKPG